MGDAEVEIEGDVNGIAAPIGGELGHFVDAEHGTHGGVVHGTIAAGGIELDIFDRAVAKDREGDYCLGPASGTNSGIDSALQPVVGNTLAHALNVPRIARVEFAAACSFHSNAATERAGSIGGAGGKTHLAALAVIDGVIGARSFILESF